MFKKFLIAIIRLYQLLIAPAIGPNCRFAPSCSDYAKYAITRYGVIWGSYLAAYRILRCHPMNKHYGYDPVPESLKQVKAWQYWCKFKQRLSKY